MDAALRGRAAALQQQQLLKLQNQQYQQNHQHQTTQRLSQHSQYSVSSQSRESRSTISKKSKESKPSSKVDSNVDVAYRRLGQRLSARAHGDGPIQRPQKATSIGLFPNSSFAKFGDNSLLIDFHGEMSTTGGSLATSMSSLTDRTVTKVPKKGYNDHGMHHHHKVQSRKGNVVRKMTIDAADLFKVWQTHTASSTTRRSKKRSSPKSHKDLSNNKNEKQSNRSRRSDLSPNGFAFSQLALEGSNASQQREMDPHDKLPENLLGSSLQENGHGLLSAVMESGSQTSSQSQTPNSRDGNSKEESSTAGSSIEKSSLSSLRTLPQGKCLTIPSEPSGNNGIDNIDGNLIVHENDAISVSRKQIHVLSRDKMKGVTRADFRIHSLLGQGTFAQVFQCVHVQTGALVAVKIVKNKPAYTRQAAVEIDIFRALTQNKNETSIHNSSLSRKVSRGSDGTEKTEAETTEDSSTAGNSKWDHMVDMVCYFMHQNHLCIVFELLGLNLYEVLKKRQFRGLPLYVVRKLVKQAISGVKELSKKNIVHCDLKPENILLVGEDDVDSVLSAGENRRLSSSVRSASFEKRSRCRIGGSIEKKGSGLGEPPLTASSMTKMSDGNPGTAPLTVNALSQSPTISVSTAGTTSGQSLGSQRIKLIDFGSACFEGQTAHTYIQSRFYRSPEVLVGLPYDSAIDMWSLGCVAAELFLGLPILPGVHEHDQLQRICEMIMGPPDWMLDQGSKASKYFVKYVPRDTLHVPTPTPSPPGQPNSDAGRRHSPRPLPQWRMRTQKEYIDSLSPSEIRKKGGLEKLQKLPGNRYFRRKKLSEIINHKGLNGKQEDKKNLEVFIHFLYGILDPDPWKRWTAMQAAQHPFLTGNAVTRKDKNTFVFSKDENQANILCDIYWEAPFDPSICRRKLLNVQKMREKQLAARRGYNGRNTTSRSPCNESISDRMQESPHDFVPSSPHAGLAAAMASPGINGIQGYRLSSSFSDYPNSMGGIVNGSGDATSVASGQPRLASGPQSYSGTGFSTGLPSGSYNDVDFVFALNRPGVVPMSDSVTTSDVGSIYQQTISNSIGSTRWSLRGQPQLGQYSTVVSRSFGETMVDTSNRANASSELAFSAKSLNRQPSASYGQVPGRDEGQVPTSMSRHIPNHIPHHVSQQLVGSVGDQMSYLSQSQASFAASDVQHSMMTVQDPMNQMGGTMPLESDPSQFASDLQQQQLAYGSAQAYLQQQHVALQQQQMMLQQQQAALALQQQQLQAYGLNPALLNPTLMPGAAPLNGNMAAFQPMQTYQQVPSSNNGYYYVQNHDGTQMMVQGSMQQPMMQPGMTQAGMAYGMPPQAAASYGSMTGVFPSPQGFEGPPHAQYPQGM